MASNALRSQSRRREVNLKSKPGESTGAHTLDQMVQDASSLMPARQVDKSEMREVVREAVGTLNERQRLAVLLSKFENMSYEDIAQTMEMTPQAIKSLLSRARGNLCAVLEPYLERGELHNKKNHDQAKIVPKAGFGAPSVDA